MVVLQIIVGMFIFVLLVIGMIKVKNIQQVKAYKRYMELDKSSKKQQEKELEVLNFLKVGLTLEECKELLKDSKLIKEGILLEEGYIDKDKTKYKQTYIWYTGWYTFMTSRFGIFKSKNANKKRGYIKIVFENDKLIHKEIKGVYEQFK